MQKGHDPFVLRSWFPQLGQKTAVLGFMEGVPMVVGIVFGCFFLRVTKRTTTITTITTRIIAAKKMGEDRKLVPPFTGVGVGVAVTVVVGVAVAVGWFHHWFIADASKADMSDCRSCTLNPAGTPDGSVNIWFASTVTELLVYWSTNMTEPAMTWIVVDPLETVTT